ncbi:MAG: STAS domain-containing protein [Pseudomonadota bacterium]
MFSFFRKEKPSDLMAFLKEGQPDAAQGPAYAAAKPKEMGDAGIEVYEAVGGLAPEFEEAAVLYANGKTGETATLLNRYLLDHPENRDPLPWYMLFDLYECTGQREHFDDAAVDFAVRFERSPPTWQPRQLASAHCQPPLMAYSEKYGSMERVKQPKFFQDAANAAYVRLDVTKVQTPDEETAKAILDEIGRLQEMRKPIELIGGAGFVVRLEAARQQPGRLCQQAWFLLLAVLRLMGREEEFDNVAVDYAVALEVSPPAYTAPLPLPKHAGAEVDEAPPPPPNTLRLQGAIGPGNDSQIRELSRFSAGKKQVDVDMSELTRIDFAVVGLLLELLIELSQNGCHVVFKNGNELVNTLLQIVGINQFATIQSRPRT